MASETLTAPDPAVAASRDALARIAEGYAPRDFRVRFWDGSAWEPDPGHHAAFTLVLAHPGAVRAMFLAVDQMQFGESFVFGDFDVEGDMMAFIRFLRHLLDRPRSFWQKLSLAWQLYRLPAGERPRVGHAAAKLSGRKHSIERDKQAIGYTYDTSNDFYALWLDDSLMYTCAYFHTPADTLAQAQRQKLDHVCRKLRLKPGERMLDVGCGWGGLVIHAAQRYGVEAVGATLSRKQAEFATERIKRLGLEGRCRVEYLDYREIKDERGFDKLSCVGMLEHLEAAMMPTFFAAAHRLLRPGGAFLNHGITRALNVLVPRWTRFSHRYVFPDGGLESVTQTLRTAEAAGFEVRDVESLREHYALTLKHWLAGLEGRCDEAVKLVGESTYRVFRLYLAGAQSGFERGVYNLHQTLFVKPDHGASRVPLTRADWYAGEGEGARPT